MPQITSSILTEGDSFFRTMEDLTCFSLSDGKQSNGPVWCKRSWLHVKTLSTRNKNV